MPKLIRLSLAIPILTTGVLYGIADYLPFDFYLQTALIRIGNFTFMVSLIVNALLYLYALKRELI